MYNNIYYELKSLEFSAHRTHINSNNKPEHDALEYLYKELRSKLDELFEKLRGYNPKFRIECEHIQCLEINRDIIEKIDAYLNSCLIESTDTVFQDDISDLISILRMFLYKYNMIS